MPPLNFLIRQNSLEYLLSDCDEIHIHMQKNQVRRLGGLERPFLEIF